MGRALQLATQAVGGVRHLVASPAAPIAPAVSAAYTRPMRSLRDHRWLHLLAFLAVALMLVAPLISRWSQARPSEPMCVSAPEQAAGALHAGHPAMTMQPVASQYDSAPAIRQHAGDHDAATHGQACDYCGLAARLLPWLALVVLCLLQLRPSPVAVHVKTRTWSALRWAGLGARGPPLHARHV